MKNANSAAVAPDSSVATAGVQRPWRWAVLAALLVLAWQALTVQANYAGNWSGLFRTGKLIAVPQSLAASTYRDASPHGYDGQSYRFLAHDPLLRQGTAAYIDAPLLRARRILVPGAAWALAAGQPEWIDGAYVLVIAASIFAGVYWLGALMVRQGRPAFLGLLFLIVPATLVSVDRMTVDIALAALTAGFAFYFLEGRDTELWAVTAAAGLVRETGLLFVAACVLAALFRRDFRRSAVWAAAALPALGWYAYLHWGLPHVPAGHALPAWAFPQPRLGILLRALDPPRYPLPAALEIIARGLDVLALAGMMAAGVIAVLRLRGTPKGALRIAFALQLLLLLGMTSKHFWDTPFGYSRPYGPLFVFLLAGVGRRAGSASVAGAAAASALVDLRLATEVKSQALGILGWIAGS
jgi:hypothetical protein